MTRKAERKEVEGKNRDLEYREKKKHLVGHRNPVKESKEV